MSWMPGTAIWAVSFHSLNNLRFDECLAGHLGACTTCKMFVPKPGIGVAIEYCFGVVMGRIGRSGDSARSCLQVKSDFLSFPLVGVT